MALVRNLACLIVLLLVVTVSISAADINAELCIEDGRVSSFYLAVGNHYQVPDKDIIVVKKRNISDDELTVVFYLARKAKVTPGIIVDLRSNGMTWMEITSRYNLTAEIFYVAIDNASGPPYGKAHGHFKKRNRKEWGSIKLSDIDIVNLVNLKFVSGRYDLSPDVVVKMREQGQSFIAINDKIHKSKAAKKDKSADKSKKTKSGKNGKSKH